MTGLLIPADVAAWIRNTVLPAGYLASIPNPAICPCQGSASGHCQTGECMRCPRTWGWHRHGQPEPETHITNSRGLIAHARGVYAAVWRAGRACRWLCPCLCHDQVQALFAAPVGRTGRRSSTGGNRIASTDRLRRDDAPQPALWEVTR
ncbi:DUF6248 family natural product biosynthesis protein [Micromonospora echinospora]|uniref:DUF6248 family natural product biosynthesis protein n=1 Tax=Micromonospora echinospora TaxID=1877 RepID=UPI0037B8DE3E